MRGSFKREETYVDLWLIHVDVWQKPTQYYKAIILQLKINKILKELIKWNLQSLPMIFLIPDYDSLPNLLRIYLSLLAFIFAY